LFNHGIINGYPDGTYRPETSVSRVEFLKLALESSDIEPEIFGSSGFSDIDETAWYAPYVRKAKEEGWIEGYEGNVFKPEQKINKVEGLKIISQIQEWPVKVQTVSPYQDITVNEWFTPIVAYAKEKNFLEEQGKFLIPDEILNRGRIADILYRIHITNANHADEYSTRLKDVTSTLPETQEPDTQDSTFPQPVFSTPPPLNFTPVTFDTEPNNFFDDVTLDESIPNQFYLNEIYNFEGTITNGQRYTKAFVFLAEGDNLNEDNFIDYVGTVDNDKISIPVIFRKPGNYKLGLILGNQGESKIISISVLPSLPTMPSVSNNDKPLNPRIEFNDEKTSVRWSSNGNELLRINIYQDKKTQSYLVRQKKEKIDIGYMDFASFKEGKTYLQIDGAQMSEDKPLTLTSNWSHSETMAFTSTGHQFSTVEDTDVSVTEMPEFMTTIAPIVIKGTTQKDLYQEAIITKPDGFVVSNNLTSSKPTETYFGSHILAAGSDFTFKYTPATAGTYIIELNSKDGSAVINTPIYVKTGIPLLPDYFDLHTTNEQENPFDLAKDRTNLLNLINDERAKYNLGDVTIDASLNNLAQLHSEDMSEKNYFSHIDLDGNTPNDRRIALNIPTPVGENLAEAPNIYYSHYGLMRSGIHRRNLLDPKWVRVGIGIAKNSQGQLLVTEEFSTNPLTSIDIANIKTDYLNKINDYRSEKGLPSTSIDDTLASIAQTWSDKMADENFFDFTSPNGESLTSMVQQKVSGKAVQALILESSDQDKLIDEILNTDEVNESQWTKIGIGLKADNIGDLKATLLFTTH